MPEVAESLVLRKVFARRLLVPVRWLAGADFSVHDYLWIFSLEGLPYGRLWRVMRVMTETPPIVFQSSLSPLR